jgi:hypothetical protein
VKVKCYGQAEEREISVSDVIMYNGACYQIITQKLLDNMCFNGTGMYSPGITHEEAYELINKGILVLVATRKEPIYKEITLDFYMLA